MRQVIRRRHALLPLPGALVIAAVIAACGGSVTQSVVTPTVPSITTLPDISEMLSDKTLGSASAPNTIIEYASFWSLNSATFHLQITPQLKSQFVDPGRASITFRNLFVNGETFTAAALSRCVGNARFFDAADTIFRNQSSWGSSSDPDTALERLMLGFGMSQTLENQCVANATLQAGLSAVHTAALQATYQLPDGSTVTGIRALPAIVVNGCLLDGTNPDSTANPANAATVANIQQLLK